MFIHSEIREGHMTSTKLFKSCVYELFRNFFLGVAGRWIMLQTGNLVHM